MKKSLLRALLLALCCCLLVSAPALAAENIEWEESVTVENPLYPSAVTAGDESDFEALLMDDVVPVSCTTEDEVIAALRSGMEQREAVISVVFKDMDVTSNYLKEHVKPYFESAMDHTGVSTQGDYLRWIYERYNVSFGSRFSETFDIEYYATYKIVYYTTIEQEAEVRDWISSAFSSLPLEDASGTPVSVREQIEAVYQYICENVSYDYTNLNDDTYTRKYTAYAAAIDGTAVCQGYSALFYRMLLELGIDNRIIAGLGNGGDHAWNIVTDGDHYYNCDVTWDSNNYWAGHQTPRSWFMKIGEEFPNHSRDSEYLSDEFTALYPTVEHKLNRYQGTPATCTEWGIREHYICTNCGRAFADEWGDEEILNQAFGIEPLGHTWGDWTYETGVRFHICTRCNESEQEVLNENTYIVRAYEVILERGADDEGLAHWTEQLNSGVSAGEIIKEFFRSEEFKSRGLSNEEIVTLCYEAMLGRAPEKAGLANWTALLDDGYSTTKLVAAIVTEPEFIQLCGYYGLTPGSVDIPPMDEKSNVTNFIRRCYIYAIGREADEGGLNNWVSQLLDGTLTPERAAFKFVFADEVHDQELDNRGFITMLYRMMLGRRPDNDGLANWVNVLDAGDAAGRDPDVVRQEAYALFAASQEFNMIVESYGLGSGT